MCLGLCVVSGKGIAFRVEGLGLRVKGLGLYKDLGFQFYSWGFRV
jgi:hypothetical protein